MWLPFAPWLLQMPIGSFLPGPFDNLMAAGESTAHAALLLVFAHALARMPSLWLLLRRAQPTLRALGVERATSVYHGSITARIASS